nr:MAG TPA: tail repeat-like protein [Caudoviricetes sp.]
MPTITGDLRLITNQPAAVTALQIHAPEARASAGAVILPAPAIVPVTGGKFTADIELGAAVCIPDYSGSLGEPIPIAIRASTTTFAEALENGRDLTPEERDRVVELYQKMIAAGDAAKAAVAKAEQSATQAAQAAAAAKESAGHAASGVPPATATVQGKIQLAGDLTGTADGPRVVTAGVNGYSVAHRSQGFVKTQPDGVLTIADDTIRYDAAAVHKGYVDARISRHSHTTDQIKGLDTALAGKAPASHTHPTSQITGLDDALAGKAATNHTHTKADITDLPQITDTTGGNTLVVRDPWGHITAADPNYSDQVATKGYIDAELKKLSQIKTESVLQNASSAKKIGRIVCLYVNINSAGGQGTLPPDFRPTNACYIAVYTPTKLAYPGWMTVSPNGEVYVQFSQSDSTVGFATAVYTSAI